MVEWGNKLWPCLQRLLNPSLMEREESLKGEESEGLMGRSLNITPWLALRARAGACPALAGGQHNCPRSQPRIPRSGPAPVPRSLGLRSSTAQHAVDWSHL